MNLRLLEVGTQTLSLTVPGLFKDLRQRSFSPRRPRYFLAEINFPPILGHVTFSPTMEIGSGNFPVFLSPHNIFVLCLAGSISPISLRWSPEVGPQLVDVKAMILDMAPLSPSHESSNVSTSNYPRALSNSGFLLRR